jgi:hypothetical protein
MRTYLGLTLVAAATSLVNVSCSQVECGQGTVERDGTCFPADTATNPANCGGAGPFATVLGLDGKCETAVPTVCDELTTREETDDQTGITTCIGTAGGCDSEFSCTVEPNKATLCGHIYDSQTDLPIPKALLNPEMQCSPTAPTNDGPCSLRLRFFDALDFAMNPTGAQPIVPPAGGVFQDGCGRYKGENMTRATFGFMGIAVDDHPMATPTDPHRLTGVATSNAAASPGNGFRAYSTRVTTDMAWTSSAGLTGMTFAQRGVLAITFRYHQMPVAGVQARRSGALIPNDDFYFSDTGVTRNTVAPAQTMTGANGTALVINSPSPIEHDGVGAEPSGCRWPANLAASVMGVTFIQLKDAETAAGAACP